jgi:DNA gyrase subunit A
MTTKEEDVVNHLFVASAHSYILVFTDQGRLYWLKVHRVPEVGAAARGKAIVNLLQLQEGEQMRALLSAKDFTEGKYVVFATRKGRVKKTELKAFSNPRANGIIAIDINEGDDLHSVELSDGDSSIFIGTHEGMAIKFPEDDVREMGRGAAGVKGITLDDGDFVVDMTVLRRDTPGEILTITTGGFGKRTDRDEYRLQSRGGKGVTNIKTTEKNGKVVGISYVTDEDQILLITEQGKMIRTSCASIRSVGRATQGVRVINLDEGDVVVAAVKVVEKEDDAIAGDPLAAEGDETAAAPELAGPAGDDTVN